MHQNMGFIFGRKHKNFTFNQVILLQVGGILGCTSLCLPKRLRTCQSSKVSPFAWGIKFRYANARKNVIVKIEVMMRSGIFGSRLGKGGLHALSPSIPYGVHSHTDA